MECQGPTPLGAASQLLGSTQTAWLWCVCAVSGQAADATQNGLLTDKDLLCFQRHLSSARANYTYREEKRALEPVPSFFPIPAPNPLPQEPLPPSPLPVLRLWQQPQHLPVTASSEMWPCLLGRRACESIGLEAGLRVYVRGRAGGSGWH